MPQCTYFSYFLSSFNDYTKWKKKKPENTQSQLDAPQAFHSRCNKQKESTQNPHFGDREKTFAEYEVTALLYVQLAVYFSII